jgi:hypothetical protein
MVVPVPLRYLCDIKINPNLTRYYRGFNDGVFANSRVPPMHNDRKKK